MDSCVKVQRKKGKKRHMPSSCQTKWRYQLLTWPITPWWREICWGRQNQDEEKKILHSPGIYIKTKASWYYFLFLPQVPYFLAVLRLITSLSKCVASLCTQNNTLWLHSLVALDKASAEFLMQSIIVLLWYWLIYCKMGRRCSYTLEIPCLSLQIVPLGKTEVTEIRRVERWESSQGFYRCKSSS